MSERRPSVLDTLTELDLLILVRQFAQRRAPSRERPALPLDWGWADGPLVCALASEEFLHIYAIPLLFGGPTTPDRRASPPEAWALAERLLWRRPATRPDLHLLLWMLEDDAFALALRRSSAPWPVDALAAAVKRRISGAEPKPPNERTLPVAEGVRAIRASGPSDKDGQAELELELDSDLAGAACCLLTFGHTPCAHDADALLKLDYGEGVAGQGAIRLVRRGRPFYSVLIWDPGRLQALRWVQAAPGRADAPLLLKARAIRDRWSLDQGAATSALIRSQTLSESAFGHASERRLPYEQWVVENEPPLAELHAARRSALEVLPRRPLISILTPVYNTPRRLLDAMIVSVQRQTYPHWELCVVDDASPDPSVLERLKARAADDERIRISSLPVNGHISRATNAAFAMARGEWVVMLDHDDELAPDALFSLVEALAANPDARIVYSDEDKIDLFGRRYGPFFKPDFSPELLLAQNYINHMTAVSADVIREVGGWREGMEGSQDHDLLLRALDLVSPGSIVHIPKVLYHWRAVSGSAAGSRGAKGYAEQAGRKAVAEHLERQGKQARVTVRDGYYRTQYALPSPAPSVTLIIPTRDHAEVLEACIRSVLRDTDYPNYRILILDNDSVEPAARDLLSRLQEDPRIAVLPFPGPFNYPAINNFGVSRAESDVVCMLNNDIEVISPDWLSEMVSWAVQPEIGCVGAKLFYSNETIQHGGVVLGVGGVAGHSHKYLAREAQGYMSRMLVHHNVSAVTGACLTIERRKYLQVGGLDERLAVAFNDVDFCIRVRDAGYRNIMTPFAELYHHESLSRGAEDSPEKRRRFGSEVEFMKARWGSVLRNDPFYSPHLTLAREDYTLRLRDEDERKA